MALVAPSIMSTTTCLQLQELQKKPTNSHRSFFSEPPSSVPHEINEELHAPVFKSLETRQKVLLLNGAREQYTLVDDHTVPSILHPREILVKVSPPGRTACRYQVLTAHWQVLAIGLNPIDWKGPYVCPNTLTQSL